MRTLLLVLFTFVILWPVPESHAQQTHYTVQSGDVLGAIASRHGVTVAQLREWNRLEGDFIRVGQRLVIHGSAQGQSLLQPPPRAREGRVHVVRRGEVLGSIAQRHGVSVADIRSWNPGLNPDRIREGQEIRIGSSVTRGQARRVEVEVQRGEVLGTIARRHNVSISELRSWNPGLDPDRIRPGQRLVIMVTGPENPSESVGAAFEGRLVHGEQLPPHRGYQIRDRRRAWGTNDTITFMMEGYDAVLRRFPNSPRVMVHDLSYQRGGPIGNHRSHQSGRDADIGYYYNGCSGTCVYRVIEPHELDAARQWTLFSFWIENDMVEYIFMDYALQRALYNWLQEQGATEAQLARWLQYPHGRGSGRGIIRHEPGHRNHLHVRFTCSSEDARCR